MYIPQCNNDFTIIVSTVTLLTEYKWSIHHIMYIHVSCVHEHIHASVLYYSHNYYVYYSISVTVTVQIQYCYSTVD